MSSLTNEGVTFSELSFIPDLRVSCASFADIIIDGKKVLTVNKNQFLNKGERNLTPVGGAIEISPVGITELTGLLELVPGVFEKGSDLRFTMHGKYADYLREWFLRRINRELNPIREVQEELDEELGLLTQDDLQGIYFEAPKYQTELASSNRSGQEGKLTLRLIEVFTTQFHPTAEAKILLAANQADSMVRLVTAREILRGMSEEGLTIGSVAATLLNPNRTIPKFK